MSAMRRRAMLKGAAAMTVAYPFLGSLLTKEAAGQSGEFPVRFVCVYTPNGQLQQHWPVGGPEVGYAMPTALSSLEPYRDSIQFLRNCQGSSGHYEGHAEVLTGQPQVGQELFSPAGGPSLDQLIASLHQADTPLPSVELGAGLANDAADVISYSEGGLAIPTLNSAAAGFQRVFGGLASLSPEQLQQQQGLGLSVLDHLAGELEGASQHLSAAERRLLDEHLTLVRQQEERLKNPPPPKDCNATPSGGGTDFPSTVGGHIQTIAQAFACDATRVATLVLGGSGAITQYEWAGSPVDYHETAHGNVSDATTHMGNIMGWHASQIATLLGALSSVTEGNGTLLDNTVVLWTSELGVHNFSHSKEQAAVMVAGRGGGQLNPGRLVDVQGAHYHDVLLTLARVLGKPELGSFGLYGESICPGMLT